MAKKDREKSPINDKMLKVEGSTAISGEMPGQSHLQDVDFADLGRMSDFPTLANTDNPEEGTGDYVVVLADFMSGVGEHDNFVKGDVRRLSRFIPDYENPDISRDIIKGRVKRLFQIKAIRKATKDEETKGHIEVSFLDETESMSQERNRRITLERENEILRERLGVAHGASIAATPGQAGSSEQAQAAVTEVETQPEGSDNWDDE